MAKLLWDQDGQRFYETGVDRGVLYVTEDEAPGGGRSDGLNKDDYGLYGAGVVWNGLTSVSENPSGAEPTALWADNMKYLTLMSAEDFACTIEAYTYPDEFMKCDGSSELTDGVYIHQQKRVKFGFCYRTKIGNDTKLDDYGYKIHIVYNCLASPSERSYATVNDSPEAITFSWEVNTTPIELGTIGSTDYRATAYLEIDMSKISSQAKRDAIEDELYGTDGTGAHNARLPLPSKIYEILS